MRCSIEKEEWPIYEPLFDGSDLEIDVATVRRWDRAFLDFAALQDELRDLYETARAGEQ